MLPFKKAEQYLVSPLHMEPEVQGNFAIEVIDHPPGYKETAVSARTAFMTGSPQHSLLHVEGVRRHQLRRVGDDAGLLMSDKAQEMIDFAEPIHRMSRIGAPSNVLIGGLGLGFIAHWAARLGHNVTVVELEPDIIKLAGKYLPEGVKVLEGDLLEFLCRPLPHHRPTTLRQFRYAIFDTWYGQNEGTYWSKVVPLRRAWAKAGCDPKRLWCWKEEDEMWAQVYRSTVGVWRWREEHKDEKGKYWAPHQVFLDGLLARFPGADECEAEVFARLYTRGLADGRKMARRWEELWGAGWDAHTRKAEEEFGEGNTDRNSDSQA